MPDLNRLIAGGLVGAGVFHLVVMLSAAISQDVTLLRMAFLPLGNLAGVAPLLAAGAVTGAAVTFLASTRR